MMIYTVQYKQIDLLMHAFDNAHAVRTGEVDDIHNYGERVEGGRESTYSLCNICSRDCPFLSLNNLCTFTNLL